MNSEELKHYGIKGQKWGRRRYQNSDGSLTPEGKKRYGDSDGDSQRRQLEAIKTTRDTTKALKPGVDEYNRMAKDKRSKKQKAIDAAVEAEIRDRVYKMSDEDLRNAVNRINMEERYTQVMQQREHIELGKSKTEKFLDATTTALRVAELAVPVALAIYGVKNSK